MIIKTNLSQYKLINLNWIFQYLYKTYFYKLTFSMLYTLLRLKSFNFKLYYTEGGEKLARQLINEAENSLESIEINEEKLMELKSNNLLECSVCKDQFEINQKIKKIPCKHHFHLECIMPWLKERNSCPVCRYELPTDDEDYETLKNQKRNLVRSNLRDRQNIN